MKFLRHPAVVVVLAIFAVAYMAYTLFQPRSRRYQQQAPTPADAAVSEIADTTPAPAKVPAGLQVAMREPTAPMDVRAILAMLPRWIEAPGRDPFQPRAPGSFRANGPKAADLLNLTAVWRQAGGRLAVVNNLILSEGDLVAGYRVDRIEAERIWVKGTNGTEHIDFKVPKGIETQEPGAATAAPRAKG
jgi:hypothetical protein